MSTPFFNFFQNKFRIIYLIFSVHCYLFIYSMQTISIDKTTLRERVFNKLRGMIIAGELLPGQSITLRELSERFGVSIIPIREALFQLESEKIIIRRDKKDYRVNTLSLSQFNEIYRIRKLIETYIGEQACKKRPQEELGHIEKVLQEMNNNSQNVEKYIFFNQKFHFSIYSYADHPIHLEIVSGLWARVGPYLSLNVKPDDSLKTYKFHEHMFRALTKKDSAMFSKYLLDDLHYSYNYLKPYISG
jgi:DNA-binding GntR family transcriptional regulator